MGKSFPSTLASAIRSDYSAGVRQRGESYRARGAVSIEEVDKVGVRAMVQGEHEYSVSLDWSDEDIIVSCDCLYFEGGGFCKHLWATALAYDASGIRPINLQGKVQIPVYEADDSDDDAEFDVGFPGSRSGIGGRPGPSRSSAKTPNWKRLLDEISQAPHMSQLAQRRKSWPVDSQMIYHLNVPQTLGGNGLTLNTLLRIRKKDGNWGVPRPRPLSRLEIGQIPDPLDRQVALRLVGAAGQYCNYYGYSESGSSAFVLLDAIAEEVLPLLGSSGRCFLQTNEGVPLGPLQFDPGPWEFRLDVRTDDSRSEYVMGGTLCRGQECEPLSSPVMLLADGWVFWPDRVAPLVHHDVFQWVLLLRQQKEVRVPVHQADELLERLVKAPLLPPITLPAELQYEQVPVAPRPCLRIRKPKHRYDRDMLMAKPWFDYGGHAVEAASNERGIYVKEEKRLILRDLPAEGAAGERLKSLGLRPASYYGEQGHLQLTAKHLPRVVAALVREGWNVEADGALYRRAGDFQVAISSGIDWFELHGTADFGGVTASLPQLLAAMKKGEQAVRLDDGSLGIVPEEWLRKFGMLAGVATTEKDHLRFRPTQAGFLDALLATQPEVTCDETFSRAREQLRRFERIEPEDAPPGFVGTLRPYQRDGLGWLHFLQRFGFGGCLADDMGLGKTVQVLALLESRRQQRAEGPERPAPSLVVVPRSLIFNWREEAARFSPAMRVLDHTGIGRTKGRTDHFDDYDLILTTYGTLRRDAAHLKDVSFDYVIFDESQAIKNAGTASAKAARLLQARHRLCLSGTPIENHLGELWSQFEVLNPGMLGTSTALATGTNGNGDDTSREFLARVLRPFILRRTKSQVAADLPEKTEQTLYCKLEGAQRKQYDELRDHYRQALLERVTRDGINKAKIQILEALLRLRQAAIHPGLIDKKRADESSAKMEALLPRLRELLDEGHKTLVFSQFTSMLSIIRSRLDAEGVAYEYLDGKTRDRQGCVARFQDDPQCRLFLISLKAGGLGLNLTAAEYVFLLDPWWNPAVEAQAIDRAHRIGQMRHVFAYRLIAQDTVEDRILELQQTKRSLADAIINADNSLVRDLSREDLELLLR
jgi:hypothetical protein